MPLCFVIFPLGVHLIIIHCFYSIASPVTLHCVCCIAFVFPSVECLSYSQNFKKIWKILKENFGYIWEKYKIGEYYQRIYKFMREILRIFKRNWKRNKEENLNVKSKKLNKSVYSAINRFIRIANHRTKVGDKRFRDLCKNNISSLAKSQQHLPE